jgi:hypothetical protein
MSGSSEDVVVVVDGLDVVEGPVVVVGDVSEVSAPVASLPSVVPREDSTRTVARTAAGR